MRIRFTKFAVSLSLSGFIIAVFLLLTTQAFAQTTGSIGGRVTDAKDNSPLTGAIIKIEGTNTGASADDNGEYTILNVQVGTYTVVATFIGYEPSKQSNVKVSVDLKTKVNFGLVSGGSNIGIDTLEVVAQ